MAGERKKASLFLDDMHDAADRSSEILTLDHCDATAAIVCYLALPLSGIADACYMVTLKSQHKHSRVAFEVGADRGGAPMGM